MCDPALLENPAIQEPSVELSRYSTNIKLWTDDHSNLFQILKQKAGERVPGLFSIKYGYNIAYDTGTPMDDHNNFSYRRVYTGVYNE